MANRPRKYSSRQQGIVAPLVAISMVGLIAMVGLALDMGHAYLNKTRLQNTVDAAALSAAKTLDETSSTAQATAAAQSAFTQNATASGNAEMSSIAADSVNVTFSHTLDPFTPGSAPPMFARVSVDSFVLPSWFIQVLGFDDKTVGASAVAGPSPILNQVCDIAPVMPCGNWQNPPAGTFFGYSIGTGQEVILKAGSKTNNEVGPGNYQNIQLDCGPGGACIRDNLAGAYNSCSSAGDAVTTKPGDNVGPNAQGLNTRFDCPPPGCGPLNNDPTYPPDHVIDAGGSGYPDTHAAYATDWTNKAWDSTKTPASDEQRRILVVPIGKCDGTTNGQGTVEVLGFGCFFMTRPAKMGGDQEIYGEFIGECNADGTPGPNPVSGPGPHTIILYKDFTTGNLDS